MNKCQVPEETPTLDIVSDHLPPASIAFPAVVPPNAADVLEGIPEAIYTLDEEWRFTYMNVRTERLQRRSRAELLGRNSWQEFLHSTESLFYREYHRAAEVNETLAFEAYSQPLDVWL